MRDTSNRGLLLLSMGDGAACKDDEGEEGVSVSSVRKSARNLFSVLFFLGAMFGKKINVREKKYVVEGDEEVHKKEGRGEKIPRKRDKTKSVRERRMYVCFF